MYGKVFWFPLIAASAVGLAFSPERPKPKPITPLPVAAVAKPPQKMQITVISMATGKPVYEGTAVGGIGVSRDTREKIDLVGWTDADGNWLEVYPPGVMLKIKKLE